MLKKLSVNFCSYNRYEQLENEHYQSNCGLCGEHLICIVFLSNPLTNFAASKNIATECYFLVPEHEFSKT